MSQNEEASIVAAFGTWDSPLKDATVYQKTMTISDLLVDIATGKLYHIESRPAEAGRFVLLDTMFLRSASDSSVKTPQAIPVVPSSSNVRSRVHEYGGAAARVHKGFAYWCEFSDGRIYRRDLSKGDDGPIEALTSEPDVCRYADFDFHPVESHLMICVKEDHTDPVPSKVKTSIVLIDTETREVHELCPAREEGFYAFPRFGGEGGSKVAWVEWQHPDMPWDGSELYYSSFVVPELDMKISLKPKKVAGQHSEISINDVKWDGSNPNKLYYLSDTTGYLLLYSVDLSQTNARPQLAMKAIEYDLGEPLWRLVPSWYAILSSTEALIAPNVNGVRKLSHLDLSTGEVSEIANDYRDITYLHRLNDRQAAFLAGKYDEPNKIVVVSLDLSSGGATFQELETTATQGGQKLNKAYISKGECITLKVDFPAVNADVESPNKKVDLYVTLYPPTNPRYQSLKGELPPTLVQVHGGPTSRSPPVFNIFHQYFTTRGFAVLDVDYGGSSGYGREYQRRLYGRWGEVDVHDTVQAVVQLSKLGKIDGKRVAIRGSSAGGFTVLGCLTKSKVFAAGVMLYGVSDVKSLAGDSSKFESHYAAKLMGGTVDEVPDIYEKRSPKADCITTMLMFQGLKDKVINPDRARSLAQKIQDAGGLVDVVVYRDEGHKIRKLENLRDSIIKTETFLKRVFGLP